MFDYVLNTPVHTILTQLTFKHSGQRLLYTQFKSCWKGWRIFRNRFKFFHRYSWQSFEKKKKKKIWPKRLSHFWKKNVSVKSQLNFCLWPQDLIFTLQINWANKNRIKTNTKIQTIPGQQRRSQINVKLKPEKCRSKILASYKMIQTK